MSKKVYKYTQKEMLAFIDRALDEKMLDVAGDYIRNHAGITFAERYKNILYAKIDERKDEFFTMMMEYAETKTYGAMRADLM